MDHILLLNKVVCVKVRCIFVVILLKKHFYKYSHCNQGLRDVFKALRTQGNIDYLCSSFASIIECDIKKNHSCIFNLIIIISFYGFVAIIML